MGDADGPKVALDHLISSFCIPHKGQIALGETMRADFAALVQDALPKSTLQFSKSTVAASHMRKGDSKYFLMSDNASIMDQVMQTVWSKNHRRDARQRCYGKHKTGF